MAGKGVFLSSSVSLKLGVVILIIVSIIHFTAFALPKWSKVNLNVMITDFSLESNYYIGLWQDSVCLSVYGRTACSYVTKHEFSGNVKAVLIMEAFSLVGYVFSIVFSLVLLFIRQNFTLRLLHIGFVCGSGVCSVIGVIMYGLFCHGDIEDTTRYVASVINTLNFSSNYVTQSSSFILCSISGLLCFFLCKPLFIVDFRRKMKPLDDQR